MLNIQEFQFIKNLLEESESQDEMTLNLINKISEIISNAESCQECLWSFYWDCGRQGDVDGLFKATKDEIKEIIGQYAYFGEILGKHSEVYGTIEESDIHLESEDPIVVLNALESGYNPLDYIQYECSKCESTYSREEFKDFKNMICDYCYEE